MCELWLLKGSSQLLHMFISYPDEQYKHMTYGTIHFFYNCNIPILLHNFHLRISSYQAKKLLWSYLFFFLFSRIWFNITWLIASCLLIPVIQTLDSGKLLSSLSNQFPLIYQTFIPLNGVQHTYVHVHLQLRFFQNWKMILLKLSSRFF